MSRASIPVLSLRAAVADDQPFLRALYAETRARELASTPWPEAFQTAFLRGQFDAQQASYRQRFPDASFDIVLAAGAPVGRLYVARLPEALTVVDITLAVSCQGRGWGTALFQKIFDEANRAGLPVRLQVAANNRARRLYQRLGFRETGRDILYLHLERPASSANRK